MKDEKEWKTSTSGMSQIDLHKESEDDPRNIVQQFVDAFEDFLNDC